MSGKLKPSIVRLPVCALSGLIAVSLVLGPAARAIADPIGVTSGVYACAGAECNVSLTGGDGFFVNGGRSPSQFPIFFALQVGSVTKVQTDITTFVQFPFMVPGPGAFAQLNGSAHPNTWLQLVNFAFDTTPFTARLGANSGDFTFTGTLRDFLPQTPITPPLFSVDLVGQGTWAASLTEIGSGVLTAANYSFTFATPSPTPEPATLLLLCSGLVVAGARKFRARI